MCSLQTASFIRNDAHETVLENIENVSVYVDHSVEIAKSITRCENMIIKSFDTHSGYKQQRISEHSLVFTD